MPAYFVTGTDTDAGKTLVTSALLAHARAKGLTTLGLKPVASGCERTVDGLRNADALALQAQTYPAVAYETINPFAFAPAIAPHLAARRAATDLDLDMLERHVRPLLDKRSDERGNLVLIEGAGGWRVPLNDREDLSGLAVRLQLPVILVVGLRLGCISHARLTADAIIEDGLELAGWVGSLLDPAFDEDDALYRDNLETLRRQLPAPCLGVIPRLRGSEPHALAQAGARYLALPHADRFTDSRSPA